MSDTVLPVPGTATKLTLDEWIEAMNDIVDYYVKGIGVESYQANDARCFLASLPESLQSPALSQPTAQEGMPEEKGLLSALKYRVEIEHSRHRIAHFEPKAKETRTDRTLIRFAELIAQLERERDAWREQANAFEDALKRLSPLEIDIEPLSPG